MIQFNDGGERATCGISYRANQRFTGQESQGYWFPFCRRMRPFPNNHSSRITFRAFAPSKCLTRQCRFGDVPFDLRVEEATTGLRISGADLF